MGKRFALSTVAVWVALNILPEVLGAQSPALGAGLLLLGWTIGLLTTGLVFGFASAFFNTYPNDEQDPSTADK